MPAGLQLSPGFYEIAAVKFVYTDISFAPVKSI